MKLNRKQALVWVGLVGLGGCGFRPVYAPAATGAAGPAAAGLAQVNVGVIAERPGQLLRGYLQQRLDGAGGGYTKLYDLVVSLSISQEGTAIDRSDSIATRIRYVGSANWSLVSADADRRTVTSGRARSVDGVNPIDIQYFYSDLQNEQTQNRLAEALADQISLQLASYFALHPAGG